MLRGTRTQYLRRRQRLMFWLFVPFGASFLFVPVVLSTGWERIFWASVMVPMYIFTLLLGIARLTDKRWYRQMAQAGQGANKRGADATSLPGLYRPRAIAFAKRIFGGGKSD